MSEHVFLKNKKGVTRKITKMAWQKAGKKTKQQFQEITEQEAIDLNKPQGKINLPTGSSSTDLQNENKYKKLVEQAKGFVKDEKYDKALEKYNEAQQIKDSPFIKGLITKTTKKVEEIIKAKEIENQEEQKQKGYLALVESGDLALKDEDPVMALEFYQNAKELVDSDEIDDKIKECETLIESSDEE